MTLAHSRRTKNILIRLSGFILLLVLLNGLIGYIGLRYLNQAYLDDLENLKAVTSAQDIAETAQIQFKTQVQEWKNILIRGKNEEDFDRYYDAFKKRHKNVLTTLSALENHAVTLGVSASKLATMTSIHKAMIIDYTTALEDFLKSGRLSIHETDSNVRGIDRELATQIDQVSEVAKNKAKELRNTIRNNMEERYNIMVKISVGANLIIAVLIVLVLLTSLSSIRKS